MRQVEVHELRRARRRWRRRSTGCAPARTTRRAATCGGILKSATISFGQTLVPEVIDRADAVAEEADVAAGGRHVACRSTRRRTCVPIAKRNGAYVII